MSMNQTDGQDRREPAAGSERRDATAPRVAYEALVEVGSRSVGGFEAEAVDVSLDGIRLRTAYLPAPGERLVCRFDGFGGEIVAEGQVAWCHDEGRGGEFGVRFTRLDPRALELLQQMCRAEHEAAESAPGQESNAAQPGARVRLHIQGLGSPMRARVRDVARGEVLIGSNLEFLRVGRDVELEDVERGHSRVAHIEHVSVDIDPETSIPQLVVALVYEGAEPHDKAASPDKVDSDELTTAPRPIRGETRTETTPEPTVIDSDRRAGTPSPKRPVSKRDQSAPRHHDEVMEPSDDEYDAIDDDDDESNENDEAGADDRRRIAPAMAQAAAAKMGAIARKVGPALVGAGAGAGAAVGRMFASVKQRRAVRREEKERMRAPKRTTAPPPSGALRSDGKKLFREAQRMSDPPPEPVEPAPKPDRKRTVFGVLLGLMAVVAIYYASSHLSRAHDGEQAQAKASDGQAASTTSASADPAEAEGAPPVVSTVGTGNVPLFGATPLSTTEPVPVPPDPNAKAEGKEGDADKGADADPKKPGLAPEWGFGQVVNPTILRLKMDGKLEGISGSESANGFTITVPGRKSVSSAAGMARKDKRIDTVNVVNYPDRAEITVRFKKEVPPFMAKATGKRLIIELSSDRDKASDKDKDKDKDKADKDDADEGDDEDSPKPKKKR